MEPGNQALSALPAPLVVTTSSWLIHAPGFLDAEAASAVYDTLLHELSWEQREIVLFGKRIPQPRLIAWAGHLGYRYSGQTLEAREPTPTLRTLTERVTQATGLRFNHVLVNRYRSETDSMGFHSDDEPELGPEPQLASLSLGATRRLLIRPKKKSTPVELSSLALDHGDLLVMGGAFQRELRHGVPRSKTPAGQRINLTFRRLLQAPG